MTQYLKQGNKRAHELASAAHRATYPAQPLVAGAHEVNDQGDGCYFVRLMLDGQPPGYVYWEVFEHDDGQVTVQEVAPARGRLFRC